MAIQFGPNENEGIQIVWDLDDHHLELDLNPDGTFEWFYSDRNSGFFTGEEECDLETLGIYLRKVVEEEE